MDACSPSRLSSTQPGVISLLVTQVYCHASHDWSRDAQAASSREPSSPSTPQATPQRCGPCGYPLRCPSCIRLRVPQGSGAVDSSALSHRSLTPSPYPSVTPPFPLRHVSSRPTNFFAAMSVCDRDSCMRSPREGPHRHHGPIGPPSISSSSPGCSRSMISPFSDA